MRMFTWFFSIVLLVTLCAPASAAPAYTVYVAPPGGVDDTGTLQAALEQCTTPHSEGCVVQLSVGTYETKQLVVSNFHGTLKGMGMGMTTIEAIPDLPISLDVPYYTNPPSPSNPYPMLITFVGGDITISDLFIKFTAVNATLPWYDPWNDFTQTTLNAAVWVTGSSAKASINRVKMEGPPGWLWTFGVWYIPNALGQAPIGSVFITGTLSVTASSFKHMYWSVFANQLQDSNVVIGGSPQAGNTFEDVATSVALTSFENTKSEVSYNKVATLTGIADIGMFGYPDWNGPCPKTASTFVMKNNTIRSAMYGIWVVDVDWWCESTETPVKSQFLVSDNTIYMEPNSGDGILGVFDSGTVYSNNRISGGGYAGIWLWGSTQCMVQGNNLQHFTPVVTPDGTFAPIVLDVDSNNCTVVGSFDRTNVLDWGTNNRWVGVNNMKGNPPGPAVRDAMRRQLEALMKGVPRR